MQEVLVLVAIGLAIGVPVALSLERLASGLFYGLSGIDPLPTVVAIGILAAVAGAAAYLPARRASTVDPSIALRCE
jgi:ABC-type antimicrobial peptide transport system permease subunit